MSRLSVASLTIWFVLLGGGTPGFACDTVGSAGDCCPDGGSTSCTDNNTVSLFSAAEACCAVAPRPAQAASISPVRVEHEALTVSGSPDLPIAFGPMLALAQSAACRDRAFIFASPAVRDGSSTYLRTLRLRL